MHAAPQKELAIVACMDCRLDVRRVMKLGDNDAHIIRNAGGVITDDVIRSLCLSQRNLGTRRIVLIHHTDCGLQGIDAEAYFDDLEQEVGERPTWALASFADAAEDVIASAETLRASSFVPFTDEISGYVYDIENDELIDVIKPE